ncbi:MAG TPA: HD domain-containing phosphohydrolase [Burkholderiales bacterium]|nr:HD domain-containing phosphohydrolase [Burkholderiales bacterium]
MSTETQDHLPCILAVDDDPSNLHLLKQILQGHYRLLFARDGLRGIELAVQERPDLILLDVMMPGMTGFEVCRHLKKDPRVAAIPVIFVTAMFDTGAEEDGFSAGGSDFLAKPVGISALRARVRAHLALAHALRREDDGEVALLEDEDEDQVQSLLRALRFRDEATAMHALRVGEYARVLGRAAGLDEAQALELAQATALHDLGMMGVADEVLCKPEPLDAAERALVRRHPAIGADIIGAHARGVLALSRSVALTHHERWDGTGYPAGLAGEAIPLSGRVVAIADVFDALTRPQRWRSAWSLEETVGHINAESGGYFDPALVRLFLEHLPGFLELMAQSQGE